ncbi:MAG: EVE domain-containing protein [Bacteroidetes bacterium]|nr:EVE domain-containing protein [Bacteroidota bacterium]
MNYWLIKSEPNKYSWDDLLKEGSTAWTGVRNYAARNNLRDMKLGDKLLFYHSNIGKEIVGIAKVVQTHFQDPTTDEDAWLAVQVAPVKALKNPVSLATIKATAALKEMELIKLSRLSVSRVKKEEFELLLALGK